MTTIQNYLKEEGFIPVALPAEGIEVQQILTREPDKAFKRLPDKVHKLFKQGDEAALPFTKRDMTVAEVSGTFSMNAKGRASIGFMEKLVKSIGVKLGFSFELSVDEELIFMFENPCKDEISSFIDLNAYLNDSTVIDGSFGDRLKQDEIYIITAVLKSSKFAVGVVKTSDLDTALNLPTVKDFVEGEFTWSNDRSIKKVIQYDGEKDLIFGIQASQLIYDRNLWQSILGKKGKFSIINANGAIMRGDDKVKVSLLKDDELIMED
jgi:hypothetical protein